MYEKVHRRGALVQIEPLRRFEGRYYSERSYEFLMCVEHRVASLNAEHRRLIVSIAVFMLSSQRHIRTAARLAADLGISRPHLYHTWRMATGEISPRKLVDAAFSTRMANAYARVQCYSSVARCMGVDVRTLRRLRKLLVND